MASETIYRYTCSKCNKTIVARILPNIPQRTICRRCSTLNKLGIQDIINKGTIDNPVEGDLRLGKEINKNPSQHTRKFMWHICPICKNGRWVNLVWGKPEYDKCSKCKWYARKNVKHPRWNKDADCISNGYRMIRLDRNNPYFSMAKADDLVMEHRYVMAQSLGRCLKTSELVHHKNHNRLDNRIENLQLVGIDEHTQITLLESKIDRLLSKQDELMTEIKLLRFENNQLKECAI